MRAPLVLVATAVAFSLLAAPPARAENLLGRAWEAPIQEGIAKQEQERKDRRPEGILRQAELLAARRAEGAVQVARLYLLARAYGINGDAAAAEGTYREVLGLARDCYFAYHDLAMLALGREQPDRKLAESHLRQAIVVHPRYATGYRKLARILLEAGEARLDEAIGTLTRVVELEPTDLEARHLLARALIAKRRFPEAEREIAAIVRKEPRNPLYRDLKAAFYMHTGKLDRALKLYQELAEELPSVPQPVQGYMTCLAKLKEQGKVDPEQWLWGLERLYRLTPDPEKKKELKTAIEEFRQFEGGVPSTPDEQGPPSDEKLAVLLASLPEADGRVGLLGFIYSRNELPEKALFNAVVRRLSAETEPSPKARQWALRILGRYGGFGLVGLVRHSLGDPDPSVRTAAVDALMALSETDEAARGAVVVVLGLYTESRDPALAAAARAVVRDLAKAALPAPAVDTEAGRREAFLTWWRGPVAGEAKILSLGRYAQVKDLFPEDVLVPYVQDPDVYVAEAAWRQMGAVAARLVAEDDARKIMQPPQPPRLDANRRAWLERMPAHVDGALSGADAVAVRARLRAWAAAKPR